MVQITKTNLTELFNGSKTWAVMAEEFSAQAGVNVTEKMVIEMFKANGFEPKKRKRKNTTGWILVIDDTDSSVPVTFPVVSEESVEEFA